MDQFCRFDNFAGEECTDRLCRMRIDRSVALIVGPAPAQKRRAHSAKFEAALSHAGSAISFASVAEQSDTRRIPHDGFRT
jgi:hypothetical protein